MLDMSTLIALCFHSQVHGIWFYDEQELEKIASLLNKVKASLPKPEVHPASLQVGSNDLIYAHKSGTLCPCKEFAKGWSVMSLMYMGKRTTPSISVLAVMFALKALMHTVYMLGE